VPIRGFLGAPSREEAGPERRALFGYYFSLATMVNDENKDAVPELVRAMALSSCHLDPVVSFVPVLERLCASGVSIGDVLADSGYAHRRAESFALPMRALGANLVMDLHPSDAARRAPSPVRSCTTATFTARQHRRRSLSSAIGS